MVPSMHRLLAPLQRVCNLGSKYGFSLLYARGDSTVSATVPNSKETETELTRQLKSRIMEALTNPVAGYYMRRDVFGRSGDFITSPEISQVFGEMVGIWALVAWMQMGRPSKLQLLELGPGRGTLMADLLRGTSAFPEFSTALEVCMVEVSPALRVVQWETLKCQPDTQAEAQRRGPSPEDLPSRLAPEGALLPAAGTSSQGGPSDDLVTGVSELSGSRVSWHRSLDSVPGGPPLLAVAHEFFDALPVHSFVRDAQRGWLETLVDVADEGDPHHLRLVLSPGPTPATGLLVPRRLRGLPAEAAEKLGAIEICAHGMAVAERLSQRIGRDGGAALIVDYGRDGPYEKSLVAIRGHRQVEVLESPGLADLSAWVDFSALRQAVQGCGAPVAVHGPIPQGEFLLGLGAAERLQTLLGAAADEKQRETLVSGFQRIVGAGDEGMGRTYQVMAITHEALGGVPPFGQAGTANAPGE